MKTKLLIIALILSGSFLANAQTPVGQKASKEDERLDWIKPKTIYGIQGGINLASIRPLFDDEPKVSMHAGLFVEERISKDFGYQTELNYSKQGTSVANSYQEFRLNYVQVPVLLNMYASDRIVVQGGGYGAILLKATVDQKYVTTQTYQVINDKTNVYDYFQPIDAGICLGLKYSSTNKTQIGIRYNYGIANINQKIQVADSKKTPDLFNNVLQFSAGYKF